MISYFIILSVFLFCVGLFGIYVLPRNLITMLISFELILLSINYNFLLFSVINNDLLAQFYALLILVIAAVETALGLSFIVIYYRLNFNINIDKLNRLKS